MAPHYSTVSPSLLTGGCVCGRVRYRLTRPPMFVHCCHCRSCQRETGSGFAINAIVESECVVREPGIESRPVNPVEPPTGRGAKKPASEDTAAAAAGPDCATDVPPAEWVGDDLAVSAAAAAAAIGPALETAVPVPGSVVATGEAGGGSAQTATWIVKLPSLSGHGHPVTRCAWCGSLLWSHYGLGGELVTFVAAGTLDRAWLVEPDVHIFAASRRRFFELPAGGGEAGDEEKKEVPVFQEFYGRDARMKMWPQASLDRYAALLPEIMKRYEAALAEFNAAQAAKEGKKREGEGEKEPAKG